MEIVTKTSRVKAITLGIILILLILMGTLLSVSSPMLAYADDSSATVTTDPLEFSVQVKVRPLVNGGYETLDMTDVATYLDTWQDYVEGNTSTNNLAIILTMNNVPDSSIASYSYVTSETPIDDISSDTSLIWTTVVSTTQNPTVSADYKYAVIYVDSTSTSNLYYYFKANANSDLASYSTYYDMDGVNISVSSDNISYSISSITASYANSDKYEISTEEGDVTWSSSTIYIKVVSASSSSSIFHYYRLIDDTTVDEDAETIYGTDDWWLPATQYDGYSIITLSESYEGRIEFCATNANQTVVQEDGSEYYVKIDTTAPIIDIAVTKADGTAYEASTSGVSKDSDWSDTAVTYTITPNDACISGVTYQFKANSTADWVNMDSSTSSGVTVYTYIVSETVSGLQFRAVSNAGIITTTAAYNANIDMQVPVFHVEAIDGLNATIESGGYASDYIKFELFLDSVQTSGVYYNYKIGDGEYQTISAINSAYVITVYAPVVAETYTFQIQTKAGLASEIVFETNILSSSFDLYVPDFTYDTVDGWAYETIAIDMYLPTFLLNDDDEYTLYYMVSGDASSTKTLDYSLSDTTVMWEGVLCKKYTAYLSECMSGSILRFFAINKASDDSSYYTTSQIFLDNKAPDIDIEAYISESTVEVGYDVWASGKVTIYIIIEESNISGLKCYNVVSGVTGKEITDSAIIDGNTAFTYSTDKSGLNVYNFMVVSGSGLQTEVTIEVGIDTSTISSESYYAEANGIEYVSNTAIATDLTIEFSSTHDGHFTYYYYQYTESNGFTTDIDLFTKGEAGVSTLVINPESIVSGQLTVHYVFILVSDAVNADGERTQSAPMELEFVVFDTRTFDIAYSYYTSTTNSDGWYTYYSFDFTTTSTIIDIEEMQFQMMLEDGVWVDIEVAISSGTGIAAFTYYGEERWYEDLYMGTSYQGTIEFRALNTAGKASNTVGTNLVVKIDNIEADPFYAMDLAGGSRVDEGSANNYLVYSTETIDYIEMKYSSNSIFNEMGTIQYYYMLKSSYNGSGTPGTSDSGWILVEGNSLSMGSIGMSTVYFVYAENIYGEASSVCTYTIIIQSTAEFEGTMSGGIYGTQEGLLEYEWSSAISLSFLSTSESDVFFWYSQGGKNNWVLINVDALAANENQTVIFYASITDSNEYSGYTAVCLGNLQDTFYFKMTNLAGDEFYFDTGVIMKLESVAPYFELSFSVGSTVVEENDLTDNWQSDAVRIVISPEDSDQNPGGVIYYYFIVGASTAYALIPGGGTSFTTDDLMPLYSGAGELEIIIRAVANADASQVVEKTVYIKIDSSIPDFEITGTAIVTGSTTARVVNSGDWMQSETITLALFATVSSPSEVVYTYIVEGAASSSTATWIVSDSIDFNYICKIIVTATNQAGLTATHEFEVNMDNDAPVISAGAIVNKYIEQSDGTFKIDYDNPNTYYIDQMITYEEANLKSATYNNFPLSNGKIIGTNSVDNTNTGTNELGQGGYVHIIIEDMAGNITELVFYMSVFPLDVNTISLSDEDLADLQAYEQEFLNARDTISLTDSRAEYFEYQIERLYARIATLWNMVEDYQEFLETVNSRSNFDLVSDYENMWTYYNYFTTADTTILYPTWLQELITEGEYGDYYNKLQTELATLEALMTTVKSVESAAILLPAINAVEDGDYEDIMRVYNAYESMTTDQRAVFTSTLYTKLIEVKRLVELLLLQDESTGIYIEGNDLSSGVAIAVETYADTTELVNNAQLSILENYVDGTARAIISVYKISLSGYGSQYDTGNITITLPISTDFQIYTKFAVYELSADGSISLIEGSMISADGTSVYFDTDSLGTFVLATNANLTYRDVNEEIYGVIGGIEIDGTLLTYITISAVALFVLLAILMIVVGVKNHWFLRTYNKAYKTSRRKRNTVRVPKGNNISLRNPAAPDEAVEYDRKIYTNKDKDM